jgi:hypothetical protein
MRLHLLSVRETESEVFVIRHMLLLRRNTVNSDVFRLFVTSDITIYLKNIRNQKPCDGCSHTNLIFRMCGNHYSSKNLCS